MRGDRVPVCLLCPSCVHGVFAQLSNQPLSTPTTSHAWGENELNPKAKTGHSASVFGKTKMGATIVDALDTMMIMNMTDEVARAREWIENDLHFTGSTYVSVFEVISGGLPPLVSLFFLGF